MTESKSKSRVRISNVSLVVSFRLMSKTPFLKISSSIILLYIKSAWI